MSKDNTQRKEVHLDNSVVNALNQMASSMHPPIKVKKLMEMILEEHASGRNDGEGGTPIPTTHQMIAVPMGQEPGMLELELQRAAAKKNIRLVKLERRLASNLPTDRYTQMMASAQAPDESTKENICDQVKSRFPHITAVLTGAGQAIEDMTVKVCDTHVILGDHLVEYMISYDYGK
jgi:hypothetical protein